MKKRQWLLFIFAAVAVSAVFASCGKDGKDTESNYENVSAEDIEYLSHVERENMGGYKFRILTRKGALETQVVDEETGDLVNDAVYRRNEAVKSMFNIDIVGLEGASDYADDALNSILAGDDQYDVVFPHARTAFNYALQNTVYNILDIDTIDLTKEWWSKDIIDSCEILGKLYVLDGDISTDGIGRAATMFFNKRIFDELGLAYPYQLVLDDEWTFDAFSKLVKQGSKDLNGDGLMNPKDDQYGFFTKDWFSPIYVLYSGGQRIYTKNTQGIPKLTLNSPKTVKIYSDYFALSKTENVFLELKGKNEVGMDLFSSGRAMFADSVLNAAQLYRSMNDDFGILPFPKYSKDDNYGTIVNGAASLLVVPTTVSDANRTGKIIESLCAIGNRDVIPAYYDVSLKTKFSRDYESEAMVDIIKDTRVYDLGYISGGQFQSTGRDLAHETNHDFSNYYAARESAALSDLESFISTYTN